MSVGRAAQQNWILKIQDGTVWGLVCGPCTPAVVAMVDEGRVDGDTVQFFINHIDTPPNAARRGIQRNVMTGKLPAPDSGNVMKFTWVAETSPTQTGEDCGDRPNPLAGSTRSTPWCAGWSGALRPERLTATGATYRAAADRSVRIRCTPTTRVRGIRTTPAASRAGRRSDAGRTRVHTFVRSRARARLQYAV